MKVSQYTNCSSWSYLIAFLLLGVMSSLLFGGIKGMQEFRKSMDPELSFDLKNIRFFTKDYVRRLYQRLTVNKLSTESELPSFYIYADEKDLDSLESDLPASGKTQFRPGHIKIDAPELSSDIQFRYRGGLPLHWLYKKKSLRVKLPPYTTYRGERQFNLVNPSTIYTVTDWISYDMARSVGLLTPEYFPARVYINNLTNGLHFYLSRIDESFLRKNKRMPGSVYSGDTIYIADPFGADTNGMNELTFPDKDSGISLMWKDHRLWEKDASRNAQSKNDRRDIKKYIEIVNQTDPVKFMRSYEVYFDKEKYNLFWGLDHLFGGFHHDLYHNHKMYFDPYKGKFEPIEWDLRFWTTTMPIPVYPLLKQVKLNPILEYERDLVTYQLWKRFSVDDIARRVEQTSKLIIDELAADPHRQHPDSNNKQFAFDKVVPFSMQEFTDAVEDLKLTYKKRHDIVKRILDDSYVGYTITAAGDKRIALNIEVKGNSPVDFTPWSIIPKALQSKVEIVRVFENKMFSTVGLDGLERLYPGRLIKSGNVLAQADLWATMTYGKEHLEPSSLHYHYLIKGISITELRELNGLTAINAITGKIHPLRLVPKLSRANETKSVHPWYLLLQKKNLPTKIVLSGDIDITEDRIYSINQQVTILPGTVFRLAKERSLIFYGKVLAIGTEAQPILFEQKVDGESWGSIIIQGSAASGSHLKHIQVTGGSLATQQLIEYPGQLNIHDVSSFKLEHCLIKDNSVGDDALHISYSKGEVSHCKFENTVFDALDMDIVQVTVSDTEFFNIGNDALDLMTSKVIINNVLIEGAGDKCFSLGEDSEATILHSQLYKCFIGIAVKDQSSAYIENLQFRDIQESAIALYQKNPRYGVGGEIYGKQLYGLTKKDIIVGEGSKNHISDDAFIPINEPDNDNH